MRCVGGGVLEAEKPGMLRSRYLENLHLPVGRQIAAFGKVISPWPRPWPVSNDRCLGWLTDRQRQKHSICMHWQPAVASSPLSCIIDGAVKVRRAGDGESN